MEKDIFQKSKDLISTLQKLGVNIDESKKDQQSHE